MSKEFRGSEHAIGVRAELERFIAGNQLERRWNGILKQGLVGMFLECEKCGKRTIGSKSEMPPTAEHCYIEHPCRNCGHKYLLIRMIVASPESYKGPVVKGDVEFIYDKRIPEL